MTKGAPEEILRCVKSYRLDGKELPLDDEIMNNISALSTALSADGLRLLGVAYKRVDTAKSVFVATDETDMVFAGFVAFLDPPKESAKEAIRALQTSGIALKILTGDSELVTKKVCRELGFEITGVVLGRELEGKGEKELRAIVERVNIFARVTPVQKNDIMLALKKNNLWLASWGMA